MNDKKWEIYEGTGGEGSWSDNERHWPDSPPWRNSERSLDRGKAYRPSEEERRAVNAAIHLNRPILLTGRPGTGKSSLAYSVARELGLGPVLDWPISTKSTLRDGLYSYDAIGRIQDKEDLPVTSYMRLGPLGTALASQTPRVVLIDEIDKSDVDLPNDLLNILEEGRFVIEELARLEKGKRFNLRPYRSQKFAGEDGSGETIEIVNGIVGPPVRTPIVILTSNGEREFPAPFLRRCIRLTVAPADEDKLKDIVQSHLDLGPDAWFEDLRGYIGQIRQGEVATDQLLNAIYILNGRPDADIKERQALKELLLRKLQEVDF